MKKLDTNKSGYALLELIFYVSLFALLSVAIVSSIVTMAKSFRESSIQAEFSESSIIMERITREIRNANSINTISSTSLKLNTTDSAGSAMTVTFTLSGTNLQLLENDALVGNLNPTNIGITSLSFVEITTLKGKAVKFVLTMKSNNDPQNRTENFYDTIVLRGDY